MVKTKTSCGDTSCGEVSFPTKEEINQTRTVQNPKPVAVDVEDQPKQVFGKDPAGG